MNSDGVESIEVRNGRRPWRVAEESKKVEMKLDKSSACSGAKQAELVLAANRSVM
jgi:hypothetical protein